MPPSAEQRKSNLRLALILASVALAVLFISAFLMMPATRG